MKKKIKPIKALINKHSRINSKFLGEGECEHYQLLLTGSGMDLHAARKVKKKIIRDWHTRSSYHKYKCILQYKGNRQAIHVKVI